MNARQQNELLARRIEAQAGVWIGPADAGILRRAEKTLTRWAEAECGDEHGNAIERDDETGRPFRTFYIGTTGGKRGRVPIPDREAGALRRVRAVCERHGLHFYHQGDPRGAALYVGKEPLDSQNYHRAVCCDLD